MVMNHLVYETKVTNYHVANKYLEMLKFNWNEQGPWIIQDLQVSAALNLVLVL